MSAVVVARLTAAAPGSCEIRVPMSTAVTQQHGFFHGGVIGTVADAAGGYAANTLLMPDNECLTAEYKINIVAPGIGAPKNSSTFFATISRSLSTQIM